MRRTALAVLLTALWLAPASAQTPEQKQATLAYLRGLQTPYGGFKLSAEVPTERLQYPASLRATSAAVRALKYFGGEPADVEACRKFVHSCFDRDGGGFVDQPLPQGRGDVYTAAVGGMAVVALKMPAEKYRDAVVKYLGERTKTFEDIRIAAAGLEALAAPPPPQAKGWVEQIEKMRNADGTFGQGDGAARDTGGAVVALLRLGGPAGDRDKVLKVLRDGQRPDGGYGKAGAASDLETTYRVLRAFVMLKEKPKDVRALREFVARCRNADGGYGAAPGQPSSVPTTYFASIVLHWLEG